MPIHLIIGPMFSGKTTALINTYRQYCDLYRVDNLLLVNHAMDAERYLADEILTHDNDSEKCCGVNSLYDIRFEPSQCKAIFINEAQLFDRLREWVLQQLDINENLQIFLCGLDSDFKRERFGELLDLIPYATSVQKLQGCCSTEGCTTPSLFTHRVTTDTAQVVIGTDNYIPVCRRCYEYYNRFKQINNK